MSTILVQLSDVEWTRKALHLACAMARIQGSNIVLLRLISVPYPSYLGTAFGNVPPTADECQTLNECVATSEDYGVELTIRSMQCISTLDALVDAAEQLDAHAVFAHLPKSRIPYRQALQMWNTRRRLAHDYRELFALESAAQTQSENEYRSSTVISRISKHVSE
jgi:hypothetical protein